MTNSKNTANDLEIAAGTNVADLATSDTKESTTTNDIAIKLTEISLTADQMKNLQPHFYATYFPMIIGDERRDLEISLRANGLRDPIVIYDGKILDGRNRFEIGKKVTALHFAEFKGTDDEALKFVFDKNVARRHLDESQRAMIAAELVTTVRGSNQHSSLEGCSQSRAAQLTGIGLETVKRGCVVKQKGCPELIEAVKSGTVAVSRAAQLAIENNPHIQKLVVEKGVDAVNYMTRKPQITWGDRSTDSKMIHIEPDKDQMNKIDAEMKRIGSLYRKDFILKYALAHIEHLTVPKLSDAERVLADKDFEERQLPLLIEAAEQDDSNAQLELGNLYCKGEHVEKDVIKAREWWHKAANQGHSDAMCNLAFGHYFGNGVPENRTRANLFFHAAAILGNSPAKKMARKLQSERERDELDRWVKHCKDKNLID